MKIKAINLYTKILSFFLVILGFQSCSFLDPVDEYGAPSAKYSKYKIKGSVISSETKLPVKNIRAVMIETYDNEEGMPGDTLYSDPNGNFELELTTFAHKKNTFNLKLEDIDGENNGIYDPKTEKIEFESPQYENGDGNLYLGEVQKDMGKIELHPGSEKE